MKQFLKLCEVVEQQGGIYAYQPPNLPDWNGDEWVIDPHVSGQFAQIVKDNNVFVFSENAFPLKPDLSVRAMVETQASPVPRIDAPFKTFSIEMINGSIAYPTDDNCIYTECLLVTEHGNVGGATLYVVIALSRQDKPGKKGYFVSADICSNKLSGVSKPGEVSITIISDDETGQSTAYLPNTAMLNLVRVFLERLDNEAAGLEKVPTERLRVGKGKGRSLVKINKIIHVAPKYIRKKYAAHEKREIVWSHSWFSRGHWRHFWLDEIKGIVDMEQIGKDRDGNYVERGRTWVVDSIKGDKDKELIHKVRVVRGK